MYKKKKLSNGIRLIKAFNGNTDTVTILALFNIGSREEKGKNEGIAHFLEHMFFQGTEKRPNANDISKELDYLGAASNAFTGKEFTGFWIKTAKENADLALDILSDILLNSKFDSKNIEKEKGAIIEEINMYEDSPMRDIPSVLENLLYADQRLGHDQLGNKENVQNFKRKDLVNFYKKYYNGENLVLTVAGNFNESKIDIAAKKYFSPFKNSERKFKRTPATDKQTKPEISVKYKKTDQTNISLGFRAFPVGHKNEHALDILDVILGGNSSSRLHETIREKFGLAYYIYTYTADYEDVGYFAAQSGVGNDKCEQAITLIMKEIKKIKETGISEEELDRAKKYIQGSMSISLESSSAIANFVAMQEMSRKTILTPKEKFDRINQVKREDVQRVAQDIFTEDKLNLAIIGPFKNKNKFEKLLKL
jgi:predicted Zn-dependent peptidase